MTWYDEFANLHPAPQLPDGTFVITSLDTGETDVALRYT